MPFASFGQAKEGHRRENNCVFGTGVYPAQAIADAGRSQKYGYDIVVRQKNMPVGDYKQKDGSLRSQKYGYENIVMRQKIYVEGNTSKRSLAERLTMPKGNTIKISPAERN